MTDETEHYDYDDFFIPQNDPGEILPVLINGRTVPITVKRGVTTGDVKAAQAKAYIQRKDPQGNLRVVGVDEQEMTAQLLATCILSWPFKKNVGTKEQPDWRDVPITKEHIKALLAEGGASI